MVPFNHFVPQGVEDILSNEYEMKEDIIMNIKKIFKSYGYRQILTPTFEYYDLFLGVEGTIDKDEMFKFIDGNGKILVLRPDVTTPIARMVATNYKAIPMHLKFCYATNIFRIHEDQKGNKREFTQAGIEYLGDEKPDADAEVIVLAIQSLIHCGLNNFKIDLGQARYFKGLIKELGISSGEQHRIHRLIENKNFAELRTILDTLDIEDSFKKILLKVPHLYGSPAKVFAEAEKLVCNSEMEEAIRNLKRVCTILCDYDYEKYISIDLGMIHHMDYYTGVIFKGYINNYGKSVLSGGRYDNLSKQYGYDMPATGFGLNIDELLEAMKMCDVHQDYVCTTDYFILYKPEDRKKGLQLASRLRKHGFIVESDVSIENIEKHIQNASYRNIKEIIKFDGERIERINICNDQTCTHTLEEFLKLLEDRKNQSSYD